MMNVLDLRRSVVRRSCLDQNCHVQNRSLVMSIFVDTINHSFLLFFSDRQELFSLVVFWINAALSGANRGISRAFQN